MWFDWFGPITQTQSWSGPTWPDFAYLRSGQGPTWPNGRDATDCVYDDTLRRFRTRRPSTLQCDSDYYESIDIEVSISILFRKSIDIGIDDTFKTGIDIEYRQYFWKVSLTTLVTCQLLHARQPNTHKHTSNAMHNTATSNLQNMKIHRYLWFEQLG